MNGTDADISGANSSTYPLVTADLGKTIKVRVTFVDDAGNTEMLTSAAYPSSGTVTTEVTPPSLSSATVQGMVLTLVYDEPLDPASTPVPLVYILTVTATVGTTTTNTTTNPAAVSVSGSRVTLTLDTAPAAGARVTLVYAGAVVNPVQDVAGNDALPFGVHVMRGNPPPPTNTPPEVANPLADQEVTVDVPFTYVVPADAFTDADGNPLTYTAALSDGGMLPSWLTFDPATRTFTGTPGPGDSGTVRVTVTASDGTATVSDEFALMVTVGNTAPTADDNTVTTGVGTAYTFTAADFGFDDTDTGDTLASVKIVTVPDEGTLALDGTEVMADAVVTKAQIDGDMLTFTPVAGASGDPYTTFTFKVNDGTDDSASAYTMTIDVTAATNTAATGAPTITGTAQVGETLTAVTTGIMDANGLTSPTYRYQWIRVNGTEADITSANSSTYILVDADLGKTIKVKVSFEDDDNYTETLTSAAYPSSGTVRTTEPLLVSASVQGRVLTLVYDEPLDEGSTPLPSAYTVTVTVGTTTTTPAVTMVSVSGRMVTLTLDPAPAAAATVTLTYVVPGTDPVQDEAGNDAPRLIDRSVTRGVRRRPPPPPPPNTPPVVAIPPVDQEATAGDLFTYVIPADAFTDADGNPLTYTAALSDGGRLPSWLTFDPATRTFTGTPGPGDGGTVRVTVMASDGTATVSDEFALMVTVRNTAPEVANPLADQEVMVDVPFTYVVPADAFTDADGDLLTYTAALSGGGMLPSWLTFDPATRTFTGTPASSDSGTVRVTVTARDGTTPVSDEFALRVLMVAPSTLRAWTSRFGRTVATHVTDAVGERLRASPEQDSQVTVGGYRLPLGKPATGRAGRKTTAEPETDTKPETATDRLASLLTGIVGQALGLGLAQSEPGDDGTDPRAEQPAADPRLGQSQTLQLPTVSLRDVLLGSSFRLTWGMTTPRQGTCA